MVSGCQMLAVAGLSQAMGVESFSGWILDTTMFNLILLEVIVLAYKNECMAWSARQGISIKHICVIQQKGYVTTISDKKCTVGRGNVRGVDRFNMQMRT